MRAQKPLLPDFEADPSARLFNGRVYLYCTHDTPNNQVWKTEDFHAFSSTDLVNWRDEGIIFSKKDVTWTDGFLWAPDCIERGGKYYLYFCDNDQIGIAVSNFASGPFHDAVGHAIIKDSDLKQGGRAMDPCIFIDDDGQAYLYFGGGCSYYVAKLKSDMITMDGPPIHMDVHDPGEGPWVHKRNGLYYLSYPTGVAKGPHGNQIMVYSTSTNPIGPWKYGGVILEDNGGGNVHGSIAEFGHQWYLFYHVEGLSTYQRRACAEYLYYNPDGSIQPLKMTKEGVTLR